MAEFLVSCNLNGENRRSLDLRPYCEVSPKAVFQKFEESSKVQKGSELGSVLENDGVSMLLHFVASKSRV